LTRSPHRGIEAFAAQISQEGLTWIGTEGMDSTRLTAWTASAARKSVIHTKRHRPEPSSSICIEAMKAWLTRQGLRSFIRARLRGHPAER
jgi:hypothetical protein